MSHTNKTDASDARAHQLTLEDISQIATLARLDHADLNLISDAKKQAYVADLNNILGLMQTLNKIDTDDVIPMASPHAISQPLREDQVTQTNQREKLMANAPDADNGLFKVPQVIE